MSNVTSISAVRIARAATIPGPDIEDLLAERERDDRRIRDLQASVEDGRLCSGIYRMDPEAAAILRDELHHLSDRQMAQVLHAVRDLPCIVELRIATARRRTGA